MRRHTSAVVTPDDIRQYVKGKNKSIRVTDDKDGAVNVESAQFDFSFKPKNFKWHVRIEATDDPSDADEKVTPDPVKFIAGFLGAGVPGGEHFEKMSAGPDEFSGLLRHLASRVESGSLGPRKLSAMLRRAAVIPNINLLRRIVAAVARTAAGQETSLAEVKKLQEEMKNKGWKVKETETDAGLPELTVDVSGIYEAKIRAESISYAYEMKTLGFPEFDEKGDTEDPISTIRAYAKRDDISTALDEKKKREELETGRTEPAPGTVPSHGLPALQPQKTIKDEELGDTARPEPIRTDKTAPAKRK